jgi:hypothetical protein
MLKGLVKTLAQMTPEGKQRRQLSQKYALFDAQDFSGQVPGFVVQFLTPET